MVIKDLLEVLKQSPSTPSTPILMHEAEGSPLLYVEVEGDAYLCGKVADKENGPGSTVYMCGESGGIVKPKIPYQKKELILVLEKLVKKHPCMKVRFSTGGQSTVVQMKETADGIYLLGYEDAEVQEYITSWYQDEVAKYGDKEQTLSAMMKRGFPLMYMEEILGEEAYELASKVIAEDIAGKIKHQHAKIQKEQAVFKERLMNDITSHEEPELMDFIFSLLDHEDVLFLMETLDAEREKTITI